MEANVLNHLPRATRGDAGVLHVLRYVSFSNTGIPWCFWLNCRWLTYTLHFTHSSPLGWVWASNTVLTHQQLYLLLAIEAAVSANDQNSLLCINLLPMGSYILSNGCSTHRLNLASSWPPMYVHEPTTPPHDPTCQLERGVAPNDTLLGKPLKASVSCLVQ